MQYLWPVPVLALVFSFGCASTGAMSNTGPAILGQVVTEGVMATDSPDIESTGEACAHNVLGLFSFGDASVLAAKNDGDIDVIATVDRKFINVLYLYGRYCTIVRGK